MNETSIRVDTAAFADELERYLSVSNKDVEEILNTKAFFIALGALGDSPKVESSQIDADLDKAVIGTRHAPHSGLPRGTAPRAALLVNARKGKHGGAGLFGSAMAMAVGNLKAVRKLSISYLKSTWLPPLKAFSARVPSAQLYKGGRFATKQGDVQVIGQDKGHGDPADSTTQGWNLEARIHLALDVKGRSMARVSSSMSRAFQDSIDKEVASMGEYFDRKMQERANQFNSR